MERLPRHASIEEDRRLLKELQELVHQRVRDLPRSRRHRVKVNLVLMPLLYVSLYLLALKFAAVPGAYLLCFGLMGLVVVVIFTELIHELCHNNVFENPRWNALAFGMFDLLGANSFIWRHRHLKSHHRFPNVRGWDTDVEQRGPIAIFPEEGAGGIRRFQHYYFPILYPLFMLNWLVLRDFKDFFDSSRIIRKSVDIPRREYFKLFFFKALYLFLMVLVPWLFTPAPLWLALLGVVLLTVTGSLLAMLVLLPPHANTGNEFLDPAARGDFEVSWLRHQLMSTNDIEASNWFTRNFMGNFNFHVVHHLFPGISAVYAPEVTEVTREFLARKGLPYKSYPITVCLGKHIELLRRNARSMTVHIMEETM